MRMSTTLGMLAAVMLTGASSFSLGSQGAVKFQDHSRTLHATQRSLHRSTVPSMGLMDVIKRLLYGEEKTGSQATGAKKAAVNRLKIVLASDRAGLDEITMAKIRMEIQDVISKYVAIQEDEVEFALHTDERLTLVTATFPLKPRSPVGI